MRKNFISTPYNAQNINNVTRNGELTFSQNSNVMPNFLIGSNAVENAQIGSQSKVLSFNLGQSMVSQTEGRSRVSAIRRSDSIHAPQTTRSNVPPITNLWAKSPRSSFLRTRPSTEDNNTSNPSSLFGKSNGKLNQSYNESFNQSFDIKDGESYNKFVQLKGEANDEDCFENWVTVFGYGSNQAQSIQAYFSEIGPIMNKIISNNGNWMHLQYESKMHAVAALNKNGRIINSMAMIGVKPCDDKTAEIPYISNVIGSKPSTCSVANTSFVNNNESINKALNESKADKMNMSFNNGSMRPLASRDVFNDNNTTSSAPKKGMLTRAFSMIWK